MNTSFEFRDTEFAVTFAGWKKFECFLASEGKHKDDKFRLKYLDGNGDEQILQKHKMTYFTGRE